MDLFAREAELRQRFEQNRAQFILTEVDVATTFCGVAQSSNDPVKTKRNIGNARLGHDTILRFLEGVHFDADQKSDFDQKFSHLKSLLKGLGEDV
jgi:hypothetical protein